MSKHGSYGGEPMDEARICEQLQEAITFAGGTHDLVRDVFPLLRSGHAQWWCNGNGAVITEIRRYPNLAAVNYWLVAGDMGDVLAMQPEIETWARGEGCAISTATGRRGWERILPEHGWRPRGTIFAKPLQA